MKTLCICKVSYLGENSKCFCEIFEEWLTRVRNAEKHLVTGSKRRSICFRR